MITNNQIGPIIKRCYIRVLILKEGHCNGTNCRVTKSTICFPCTMTRCFDNHVPQSITNCAWWCFGTGTGSRSIYAFTERWRNWKYIAAVVAMSVKYHAFKTSYSLQVSCWHGCRLDNAFRRELSSFLNNSSCLIADEGKALGGHFSSYTHIMFSPFKCLPSI